MQPLPKISIVIPSYNQGKYIEQTILSVLNQEYTNWELIVIDGGSADETVSIVKKYEQKLAYWVSEKDDGQAHAINKGLRHCTGQFFNWLNSDDYLEPGALNAIADSFRQYQKPNMVCGNTRCFFDEDNTTSHVYRMGISPTIAATMHPVIMNQPGSYYALDAVKEVGGVNESLRYVFDDELWFRFLVKYGTGNIAVTDSLIANFRLHGNSKSVGEGFDAFHHELEDVYIDMAKSAGAQDWLIGCMMKHHKPTAYTSRGRWHFSPSDAERLLAGFAAKYINTLYLEGNRPAAKQALQLARKHKLLKPNRTNLSLSLKLLFS